VVGIWCMFLILHRFSRFGNTLNNNTIAVSL
jgi:hypothetical protein